MVRPKKQRRVLFITNAEGDVILSNEEVEAIRLVDFEGRKQEEAAELMGISQPTLNRILNSARKKIAEAVLNGKSIGIKSNVMLKGDNVRIAIATERGGLNDVVSNVFGRCRYFTIVDVENGIKRVDVKENPGFSQEREPGIAAAQFLINEGVEVVIAGNMGPNSSQILTNAGIKFYLVSGVSAEEAIKRLVEGTLTSTPPFRQRRRFRRWEHNK